MTDLNQNQLAGYIDHTLLDATATSEQIKQVCREAIQYGFGAVSVNGRWVMLAADELHGTSVKVDAVVSLPLGGDLTETKAVAAKDCIFAGADEIDMVADLASIIEGDRQYLAHQLLAVLKVCHSMRPRVLLKVIIESAVLTDEQKIFAAGVASDCDVDFVKTSTGMNAAGGATVADVKLLREYAPNCRVKAAGGIRTAKQAVELINAGAERIGTSASVQIIKQFEAEQQQ